MNLRPTVIELVAADMATTLAFYRRLGMDIPAGADQEPHVEAELGGGIRLAFDSEEIVRSLEPEWDPQQGSRVSLACECASPAEVDKAWAELTEAGYRSHHAPWNADWGMRYAVVLDPDGVGIDLFALLPQS